MFATASRPVILRCAQDDRFWYPAVFAIFCGGHPRVRSPSIDAPRRVSRNDTGASLRWRETGRGGRRAGDHIGSHLRGVNALSSTVFPQHGARPLPCHPERSEGSFSARQRPLYWKRSFAALRMTGFGILPFSRYFAGVHPRVSPCAGGVKGGGKGEILRSDAAGCKLFFKNRK